MYGKKLGLQLKTPFVFLLSLLIYLSSLNNMSSSIKVIGYSSLLFCLTVSMSLYILYISKKQVISLTQTKLIFVSSLFVFITFIGLANHQAGLITFLQFLLLFGIMLTFSTIKWERTELNIIGIITIIFILIQALIWTIQGFPNLFKSVYGLSNLVGSYMFYAIIILFIARNDSKRPFIYSGFIILSFILMLATDTRSVLLALAFFIFTYCIWKVITRTKLAFITFYLIVSTFMLSIIFLYPKLPTFKYFYELENFMIQNTGKSLMSGRQYIWEILVIKSFDFPLLGHGTGIQNSQISSLEQSSHNLYLQLIIQNGYLGLLAFMILMLAIWLVFWKGRKNKTVRIVSAAFIATLVYQSFEITFTQNALSIGIIQWAIIGIGISKCIYSKNTQTL